MSKALSRDAIIDKLNDLQAQINALRKKVEGLDTRIVGLVRVGGFFDE